MIKKILPVLLQTVFVFAGVAGGIYAKSSGILGGPKPAQEHAAAEHGVEGEAGDDGEKHEKKEKKKEKASGHGGEEGETASAGDTGVLKFDRQFVVPVIRTEGANSLVVLDIGIQVPPERAQALYQFEPKLRDAVLGALLQLSNEGYFDGDFLAEDRVDRLRSVLLIAAKKVIGPDAQQIYVLNLARQDV